MTDGCIVTQPIEVLVESNTIAVEVTTIQQEIVVEDHAVTVEVLRDCNITVEGRTGYQYLTVTIASQSVFDLLYVMPEPDKSRLYLNGQKLVFGVDYNINATVLNYFGVALATTDYLEIYF